MMMNSEQIKRAIEHEQRCKKIYETSSVNPDREEYANYHGLAIQALQSELDRQENKALTLSELKDMVGEPVYMITQSGSSWVVMSQYHLRNLEKSSKEFGAEIGLIQFYKHKPTEGVGR